MASDVLGAYKILINAKPDEAVDAFKAVVDASTKTKDSLFSLAAVTTALNQGFELIGKAKDLFFGIGETFANAAIGIKDFAAAGGEYKEQRNQLENLANSYGISGQKIIDTINNITDNTTNIKDTMEVATRAINTGLGEENLKKILTYSKKWSESVGGSFKETSVQIINALQKGSGEALEKFGLTIQKGAGVKETLDAISAGLERFGNTGFNAADKFSGIVNSIEEFRLRAGAAINDSVEFGDAISGLKDEVVEFVQNFDYTQITLFVSTAVQGINEIARSLGIDFSGIFAVIKNDFRSAFSDGEGTAKAAFTTIIDYIGITIQAVASISNAFTTVFRFDLAAEFFIYVGGVIKDFVNYYFGYIRESIASLLGFAGDAVASIVNSFPKLAISLGIDEDSADNIYAMAYTMGNLKQATTDIAASFSGDFVPAIFQASAETNNLAIDLNKVADGTESLKNKINAIDLSNSVEQTKDLSKTYDEASENATKIGKAITNTTKETKDAKESADQLNKTFKDTEESIVKGLAGAFSTVDTALKGYIETVQQGFDPSAEMKIRVQLEEERFTRQQMIDALLDLADKITSFDPMEKIKDIKIGIQVTGDDLLDKIFQEAIIRAGSEGTLVAGV